MTPSLATSRHGTAIAADVLLLRAGDDLVVAPRDADGLALGGTKDIDPSRRSATVTVSSVPVEASDGLPGAARPTLALARTLGAAEAAGVLAACTDAAVAYAQEHVQFGRTIGTFQAVKHHCADMLVAAELATATVWDAARAAADTLDEFDLAAAMAAHLAFAPAVHNAQMNIQVHGGIGFTWEHDAHLFLRRALSLNALLGTPADAEDVTAQVERGTTREVTLDLPPEAEAIRAEIRADAARIGALPRAAQRKALMDAGLLVPHWPEPWGRAAGAVEQIVIDEELRGGREGAGARHYRLEHHDGQPVCDAGPSGALGVQDADGRIRVVPALQRARCRFGRRRGYDAGHPGRRRLDGQRPEGVDQWRPVLPSRPGHCADGPRRRQHAGITAMVIDMHAPGVEVRPLRQITGNSDFNEVFFNDVFVPDDDVVGTPNDGWTVARSTLGNEQACRLAAALVASSPHGPAGVA